MSNEYQCRTAERLIEILRAQDENPRSWQQEAADEIERLRAALTKIVAIEDTYDGGDWDEIDEARGIAREALTER